MKVVLYKVGKRSFDVHVSPSREGEPHRESKRAVDKDDVAATIEPMIRRMRREQEQPS